MTCSDSASAGAPCDTRRPSDSTSTVSANRAASPRSCVTTIDQRALVGGRAQRFHDIDLVTRIERGGRLVRQDHRRLHREHARQRDAAALAAGEFGDAALAEFHDVGRLHRPQHGLGVRSASIAPDRSRHADSGRAPRYPAPAAASARCGPAADRRSAARARASEATTAPRRRRAITPSEATSPASARNSVVLPAPFGPTSATRCPGDSASEISRSTARPDSLTLTPCAVRKALMPRRPRARGARA